MIDKPPPIQILYDRELRFIERAGQLLLTFTVAGFVAMGIWRPEPYEQIWKLILTHMVGGRAGNVAVGIELGFSRWFLLIQCSLMDVIILFLCYPLLVAGYRRVFEWRYIGPALAEMRASANRHKTKIGRFGVLGLAAFVIFPFWNTGALVGAVVGYLVHMPTRTVFTVVITADTLAVGAWILFWDRLQQYDASVSRAAFIIVVAVFVIATAYSFWRRPSRIAPEINDGTDPPA